MSETITCRSCLTKVPALAVICSNELCARDPRADPPGDDDGAQFEPAPRATVLPGTLATPGRVIVTLPNFDEVSIQPGGTLLLGRESAIGAVAAALAPYTDVGRNHCVIRNADDGIVVEARDRQRLIVVEGIEHVLDEPESTPVQPGNRIRLGLVCHVKVDLDRESSQR